MTPAEASGIERLTVLRVLVAGYVGVWTTVRAPALLDATEFSARRFDPVGPLFFLDRPVPAWMTGVGIAVTVLAAVLFAIGWRPRVSGPTAAVAFLFVTTYRNSWGQLFHTENLAAMHLVVLAVVSFRPARGRAAVDAMAVLTVGTYFVAGIAKLRIGGWAWLDGDVLRHQIAFDNARKEILGDASSPLAPWVLRHGWLLGTAAVATIAIELGAPLALLGRRLAAVWAALAFTFHVAILAVMFIVFPYHLSGIALAPLLPVERLRATVHGWTTRSRRALPTSTPIG